MDGEEEEEEEGYLSYESDDNQSQYSATSQVDNYEEYVREEQQITEEEEAAFNLFLQVAQCGQFNISQRDTTCLLVTTSSPSSQKFCPITVLGMGCDLLIIQIFPGKTVAGM